MAMNLGDEQVQNVNASHPQLIHTSSQHSIAASDDFYSFSDRDSPVSSSDEATTVIRHNSPEYSRHQPTLPPLESTGPQDEHATTRGGLAVSERHDQARHSSVYSRTTSSQSEVQLPDPLNISRREESVVVAGDQTPRPTTMVRAAGEAIDEVAEERPLPTVIAVGRESHASRNSYFNQQSSRNAETSDGVESHLGTVSAAVVAENPNVHFEREYTPTPPVSRYNRRAWRNSRAGPVPTPDVDPTPELHFALDQLTRDEEISGRGRNSTVSYDRVSSISSPMATGGNTQRTSANGARVSDLSERALIMNGDEHRSTSPPWQTMAPLSQPQVVAAAPAIAPIATTTITSVPPRDPRRSFRTSGHSVVTAASAEDWQQYGKFSFVPVPLQWWSLLGLVVLCMFIVAALIVSSVHSSYSDGMNRYDGTGTSLYFVYKYLPQLFAMVSVMWLHVVQGAIQRVLPFALLVKGTRRKYDHDVLRTIPLIITNYLLPNLSPFQHGEIALGVCNIIFWAALFTVPLAATLYTPIYVNDAATSYWKWSTVQAICWTLIPLYFLLIVALIFALFRFNIRPSGLRWDPVSIADILVLLQRGNTSLKRLSSGPRAGQLDSTRASLGLWRSPSDPSRVTHGIAVPQDIESGTEQLSPQSIEEVPTALPELHQGPQPSSTFDSWQTGKASRYSWLPWFLRPSAIALWIALALVLLIAFLIVSWLNHAVLLGFAPDLPAGPGRQLNFSSANFLYGFLPALFGTFLYLFWLPIDTYFRALQPYASMQKDTGEAADRSILLDYNSQLPFFVTFHALTNRHWKVAWISFNTLVAATIPVIAGGVFEVQYVVGTAGTIHEIASEPGYIALCVFVTIYALSYLLIWPTRKRKLPHDIRTVGNIGDFVIGGHLLRDAIWREPKDKKDLRARLTLHGFTGEKNASEGLFRFGEYTDVEGKNRVGICRE